MPLGVSSTVARTARGRIEYAVVGTGAPVVVLHGSPGGIDAAHLMGRFLPEADFAAVLVSRPGYMDTPLGDPPSIDAEVDLLVTLLDELGIDRYASGVLLAPGLPRGPASGDRGPRLLTLRL